MYIVATLYKMVTCSKLTCCSILHVLTWASCPLQSPGPVHTRATFINLRHGVDCLKGSTLQVCEVASETSLLPSHLKSPAALDTDRICTLNSCAVFSLSHLLSQWVLPLWIFGVWFLSFRGNWHFQHAVLELPTKWHQIPFSVAKDTSYLHMSPTIPAYETQ